MVDTKLWASVPFGNRTAWTDFVGSMDLWQKALAQRIFAFNGATYRTYPLGNGGGGEWLLAVQATFSNAARALGVAPPPDLESYDLDTPGDFASWTFIVSTYARQLANAAGLV